MSAPVHRYVVTDLLTDHTIGEVPLGGVSYSRRLSAAGDLTGGFPVGSQRLGDVARVLADRPCGIYAYRGRDLWWGGVVWQAPTRQARRGEAARCDVVAATFDDHPNRRRIFTDLDLYGLDRGEALAQLWDRMQADGPTAGVGVEVGTPRIGGDTWSGSWLGSAAVPWAEAMKQVADVEPAVEWTIDVWADQAGVRHRTLRVGTPLLGHLAPSADWRPSLLVTPDRVIGLDAVGDHTSRPTHVVARGASTAIGAGGESEPISTRVLVDADAVAAGAPRVDAVVDLETEDDARLVAAGVEVLGGPNRVPQISVTLPDDSTFHPGQVGDIARARVDGFQFAGGRLDTVRRLIGVTVEPTERGRPEKVTFTFHNPVAA